MGTRESDIAAGNASSRTITASAWTRLGVLVAAAIAAMVFAHQAPVLGLAFVCAMPVSAVAFRKWDGGNRLG